MSTLNGHEENYFDKDDHKEKSGVYNDNDAIIDSDDDDDDVDDNDWWSFGQY